MRRVAGAIFLCLALTACGSRWSDEQKAAVAARGSSISGEVAGSTDTAQPEEGVDVSSDTTVVANDAAVDGAPIPGQATANRTVTAAKGALPCAARSNEKGVSDSTIVVAEISSESGPAPGLGSSSAAAVQAQVARRNARGGVCGRKVVLKRVDDGTDQSQYQVALRNLEPQVLGIAGGFAVGDVGSDDLVNQLKIPIVNSPTGTSGRTRWVFDINPNFPRPDMVIGKYKWLFEHGAKTVAMVYIAVDQSRLEAGIQRRLMEGAGMKIVQVQELPLSTLSYDSAARTAANSGADYLWFISTEGGQSEMAKSVRDTGYKWKFREHTYTAYGTSFVNAAGEAAEGVSTWIRSVPVEEASQYKAMGEYVEWMDRVAGDSVVRDLFSIDSYVAAGAFLDAVEQLPGPITREAVVKQLETFHNFDAAGMYAPIDLGRDLSKGCFLGLIVKNGKWERMAPTGTGYLC